MGRILSLLALTVVCLAAPLQGCAALNSKELTRSRALALLREHKEFKTPKVLPLRDVEKFNVPALSEDEDPVPYERAVETYFENYPDMGVLRELGLVEAKATLKDRPQMLPATRRLLGWRFFIDARLTARGREAAMAAGGTGERRPSPLPEGDIGSYWAGEGVCEPRPSRVHVEGGADLRGRGV